MTSFTTIAWLVWLSMTIWLYSAISLRVKIRGFQCLNVTLKGCPCGQYPQCPYLGARMCKHCAEKGTLACMMTTLDSHTCTWHGVYAYMKLWHSMQETGYFRLLPPFYNDPPVDFDLTQQNEWWLLFNDATPFATICLRTVSLAKGSALWTICPPYLIKACAETLGHIASIGVCHASDYGHKLSKHRL